MVEKWLDRRNDYFSRACIFSVGTPLPQQASVPTLPQQPVKEEEEVATVFDGNDVPHQEGHDDLPF